MKTRQDVVSEARSWLSTPWKHQAALKGVGVDCVGLLTGIARNLELADVFDPHSVRGAPYRGYGREPNPVLIRKGCEEYLDPVSKPGLGDILLMRFDGDRHPRHFAVITKLDPRQVVHAYAQARKVVETSLPIHGGTVLRAYRFRGIE